MLVDAIVLSGGRSSRLDFVPKSEFTVNDATLLDRALRAAGVAQRIVVVGPEPSSPLPDGVLLTREDPPFSGPASGIAAGMDALASNALTNSGQASSEETTPGDAVLVLACDMPHADSAVLPLLRALDSAPDVDGAIAIDGNLRRQPLAAVYRTGRLREALETHSRDGSLVGLPMFRLLEGMSLVEVEVPPDATADVDSWDDAVTLGAQPPDHAIRDSTHP